MDNVSYKITGLNELQQSLDAAPDKMLKASKSALRASGNMVAKKIRRGVPVARWRPMVKCKVVRSVHGEQTALIGLFNTHNVAGHQRKRYAEGEGVSDWFKAYWKNYGTLTLRDPDHDFVEKVKHKTKSRRNNKGQKPEGFFEHSIENWQEDAYKDFDKRIEQQLDKIL